MDARNRRILGGLLFLAPVGAALYYAARLASVGAAYKAKILCSGIFVAHRDPQSVIDDDLSGENLQLLRFCDAHVDYQARSVTAGFLNLVKRRAIHRQGVGCSLVYGDDSRRAPDELAAVTAPPGGMTENLNPRLESALDWAFSEPDPALPRRTRAVVVLHKGEIVAERYAPGFGKETPLLGWSMTKGVINALAGIMVREGKLSLTSPLSLPQWQKPGDPRGTITLEQLLRMSSGLKFDENYSSPFKDVISMLLHSPDTAVYALNKPLEAVPGSRWSYSSGTSNIISYIIRRLLAEDEYVNFPRRSLFEPLGMNSAVLEQDASGTFVGSSLMYATARDWARLGRLYLQDGVWDGQRILPEGWVAFTRSPAPQAPEKEYGAHFWLKIPEDFAGPEQSELVPADAFHAVGYEGQFITIVPSRDLVLVRLGLTRIPSAWRHDRFTALVLGRMER